MIGCNNSPINEECQYFPIQQYVEYAIPYSNGQEVTFKTSDGELINLVIEREEYMWEKDDKCIEGLSIKMKYRDSGNLFSRITTSGDDFSDNDIVRDLIITEIPYEFINAQSTIQYELIALQDGSIVPVILEDPTRSPYEAVERYEFHEFFEFNDYTYFNTLEVVWKGLGIENEQAIKKFYYSAERGLIYAENFDGETITLIN